MNGKSRGLKQQRDAGGWRPALLLFFTAPLVGEFLLGNLSITWLWVLIILAPLYGGGALLIRETARRLGLGWPGILMMSLGYAVIEEAFVTQSLFNPNYVGLRLLDYGYIPSLGIGAWWTVFVLAIHVIWSMATSIALVEALSANKRRTPWLGPAGVAAAAVIFLFGCVASAMVDEDPFQASNTQLIVSGIILILLLAVSVLLKEKTPASTAESAPASRRQNPAIPGAGAFLLGSGFMILAITQDKIPAALNVFAMFSMMAIGGFVFWRWSQKAAWSPRHELAIAGGFLFTYAWYGFAQPPSVGEVTPMVDAIGNAIFAAAASAVFALAWRRTR